jgi:flagellar motor switch protein FliN
MNIFQDDDDFDDDDLLFDDDDFDEDDFDDDEDIEEEKDTSFDGEKHEEEQVEEEETEEFVEAEEAIPQPVMEEEPVAVVAAPLGEDGGVPPKDIPMTITVEAGRLEMSAEKLIALRPGNMLELPSRPETGVSLVVNGKRVGKGELIRIGETLGVRILAMG